MDNSELGSQNHKVLPAKAVGNFKIRHNVRTTSDVRDKKRPANFIAKSLNEISKRPTGGAGLLYCVATRK